MCIAISIRRIDHDDLFKLLQSLFVLLQISVGKSPVVVGLGVLWVESNGLGKVVQGLFVLPPGQVLLGHADVAGAEVGILLDHRLEGLPRLFGAPHGQQAAP